MKNTFYLFLLLMILSSCNEENDFLDYEKSKGIFYENRLTNEELVYVKRLGYTEKDVVVKENILVIKGDLVVKKEDVIFWNKFFANDHYRKHKRYSILVEDYIVGDIKVFINQYVNGSWRNATQKAILEWNRLPSTKIKIIEVDDINDADIEVKVHYDSNSSTVAWAYYPHSNTNVGSTISINTAFNYYNDSIKLNTMIHEFGHTLGFLHTNQNEGIDIPCTPNDDFNSVMHSNTHLWYGFTGGDKIAFQSIYPDTNKIISVPLTGESRKSDEIRIKWDKSKILNSTVTVSLYQKGKLIIQNTNVNNDGSFYFDALDIIRTGNATVSDVYDYSDGVIRVYDCYHVEISNLSGNIIYDTTGVFQFKYDND